MSAILAAVLLFSDTVLAVARQVSTQKPSAAQPVSAARPQAALAQPQLPQAKLLWSSELDKDAPEGSLSGSGSGDQRSAVIAGDRVVVVFEAGFWLSRGGRPVRTFRLLSLDLKTGQVRGKKEIQGQSQPHLFATGDDHILLAQPHLTRLNPDLTESGEHFTETGQGRTIFISSDGSTLAYTTDSGTEFLSAATLSPTGVHVKGQGPTAASNHAVLSDDISWASRFPQELSFVATIDEHGQHLLYHGNCGGRPEFLSSEKIIFIGCGGVTIIDTSGKVLKQVSLGAAYGWFAGVSRDGAKFAIQLPDYSTGDPAYNSSTLFTIYNSETYEPMATVRPETPTEARPWSAFSGDGSLFVCGSARKVSLYRIQ